VPTFGFGDRVSVATSLSPGFNDGMCFKHQPTLDHRKCTKTEDIRNSVKH